VEKATTIEGIRSFVRQQREGGKRIALVPTMGALHAGHMALVEAAKTLADCVIVSIFVNPRQFGPREDLSAYPRRPEEDNTLCAQHGVAAVFLPSTEVMYPQGYATNISVSGLTENLDGAARPGHFDGVATVVTKLLLQVAPDVALFGEKDYQQLQVIKRLVRDLNIPVRIEGIPTVREPDGLALSSRNAYLTPQERVIAPELYRTLCWMRDNKARSQEAIARLLNAGFASVDYIERVDANTLQSIDISNKEARILAAARLGKARLIDNITV
jgi:pantoate--beta-alanine ligase